MVLHINEEIVVYWGWYFENFRLEPAMRFLPSFSRLPLFLPRDSFFFLPFLFLFRRKHKSLNKSSEIFY